MSKTHRLFKVARELNTGSSTLVNFLNERGFEVENNLNAKLNEDMYSILLKEFASEKELKKKAELIKEKKREERNAANENSSSEEEEEILSAADLKSGILDSSSRPKPRVKPKLRPMPKPGAKTPADNPPAEKEKVEAPKSVEPEKESPAVEEEKPQKEAEAALPGLKVVDKIDLAQIGKTKKRAGKPEKSKPVVIKKPAAKKEAPKSVEEKPVEAPAAKAEPVVEKQAAKEESKPATVEAEKPVETPPVVAKEAASKEEKPAEGSEKPAEAGEKPAEEGGVVRASDHTPKLKGLKVLGTIKLPGDRSKTKKDDDSDADKKKRKRKRRRKKPAGSDTAKKPTTSRPNSGARPTRRGPTVRKDRTKEEPTEKEIKEQIKRTLAEIESRASRSRQRIRRDKRAEGARRREQEAIQREESASILEVTEFITANELAHLMNVQVTQLITKCMEIGMIISINQRLDAEVIELLTEEFGFEVSFIDVTEAEFDEAEEDDDPEDLVPRPPIVTVMGHVDHGKTSLLDYIRKANVIAGEAGGITQHIGAYNVEIATGEQICFLDTPGHEAFTAMRARGAKVTDLAIIVIAADDDVMPQTKEAINHAEAAGVPMIFALNKMDKPGANPDRIRTQLSEMNILLEDWGGKFQSQEISAKKGEGIDELLEKVILEAEILELKANPDKLSRGTIIESRLDKGRGITATMLVQEGQLKVGDPVVAGIHHGRVRALMDERGKRIKSAGPSTPVQILGLSGAPQAGDRFVVYPSEKEAKEIAGRRMDVHREQAMRQTKRLSLEEIARRSAIGDVKDLNIIVKGDVDGSIEALSDSLLKLSIDEVQVNVVRKAVGQISEADVLLASASSAIIIGFQVRPSVNARRLAEDEGIDIRLYSVIYDAINDVKDALEGMLSPDLKEEIVGTAEIRDVFKISKVGNIGGCMVQDGTFTRKDPVRLIRDGIVVYNGNLASLKRFKDDAKEVKTGFECGMQIENYNDIKVGDIIEQYRTSEVKRTLGS